MSAVIWFGIVAVWAFVLIPTWVRRSDIHWRRSGETSGTRDKIGRAARVISRSGSGAAAGARGAVPGMRRPSAAPRRSAGAEGPRTAGRSPETDTQTDSETPTRTATSAQAADAAATEAPMTTARTSRPAPRRGAPRA